MSWSGFKKAASRAGTQVMMKTGHVEKTADREYGVEERRYRTLESAATRLQKEAKGYLDSLRAMTASQMRIAETIDAFYGDSGAKDGVSRSYKQAVEDLDAETVKALDGPYRCVPQDLYRYAWDEETGIVDQRVIDEVEKELNFKAKTRRTFTMGDEEFERAIRLMDYVYRTTVLEPISRFCAYFPDINECIKKRNHKMLDYDAIRARVRKLTEKPDKDPSKLPRAEKEAEMVSVNDFLRDSSPSYSGAIPEVDLTVPSPPKVLDKVKRVQQLQRQEDYMAQRLFGSVGLSQSSSFARMSSPGGSSRASCDSEQTAFVITAPRMASHLPLGRDSSTEALFFRQPKTSLKSRKLRSRLKSPLKDLDELNDTSAAPDKTPRKSTPFLHPPELEQIMQPLKAAYMKNQTDELQQAKAAYEQLNEQLTNEIPQLIDLRVPYLDPSFEALVKIQLRFCAEAYSRMAQVQQYLDASTRDQYASGELDARVEDVLGQIRELSIAGTV